MRYLRGVGRHQISLLTIDDQIGKSHIARFIDEICESFCESITTEKGLADTGRKAYHPADLLKILVYGYFNGISSSRRLELETHRNIELKWLISDICPDHKTISDFRKDNPELVDSLFKYLISKLKEKGLITGKGIVVDGTKIKANASRELNIDTIRKKLDGIDQQVAKYLTQIEIIDREEDNIEELERKKAELEKELTHLEIKKKEYSDQVDHLRNLGQNRVCTTDEDTKVMKSRRGTFWGYNAQAAVDTDHHMITSIKVTSKQNDKGLLPFIVQASEENTGEKAEEVSADAGYYKMDQIEALEKDGDTTCYVAVNLTQSQTRDQQHGLTFKYIPNEDRYICVKDRPLEFVRIKKSGEKKYRLYQGTQCHTCPVQKDCTKAEQRNLHRNENQQYIDQYLERMSSPDGKRKVKARKSIVEHPFGTIKYMMGQIPLSVRGKQKVQTEMTLYAMGYNLKRYATITTRKRINLPIQHKKMAA